jgi:hypothetical protein
MTRIILDPELREKLHNLIEPLELCDEGGHVLAHLTPADRSSGHDRTEPQISREEVRRRKENKGKPLTTAEVLAFLETL